MIKSIQRSNFIKGIIPIIVATIIFLIANVILPFSAEEKSDTANILTALSLIIFFINLLKMKYLKEDLKSNILLSGLTEQELEEELENCLQFADI